MNLISRKSFSEQLGVPETTVKSWVKNYWTQGQQYVLVGHTTLIKVKEAETWLNKEGRNSKQSSKA